MTEFANFHPEYTNYTRQWQGCIDWIMYSSQSLNLISILKIPPIEELSAEDMETEILDLPNKLYPSDHLRIEAVFQVK